MSCEVISCKAKQKSMRINGKMREREKENINDI